MIGTVILFVLPEDAKYIEHALETTSLIKYQLFKEKILTYLFQGESG
jgi:hypothetical protein